MDALQHSVIIAQGWSFRVGGLDGSTSGADRFGIVAVSIAWATRPCETTELNCCGHRPPLQAEMKKPLAPRCAWPGTQGADGIWHARHSTSTGDDKRPSTILLLAPEEYQKEEPAIA